jgi:hypothetical protein
MHCILHNVRCFLQQTKAECVSNLLVIDMNGLSIGKIKKCKALSTICHLHIKGERRMSVTR